MGIYARADAEMTCPAAHRENPAPQAWLLAGEQTRRVRYSPVYRLYLQATPR